ncbi:MAG: circadian clock KaiB family protein [Pseudomonadota bacterium]
MTVGKRNWGKESRTALRLYVAGSSPNSVLAQNNVRAVMDQLPQGEVTLEVIDVLANPARAQRDRVIVTPTLLRLSPLPELRMIGNLRDRAALLLSLGLGLGETGS